MRSLDDEVAGPELSPEQPKVSPSPVTPTMTAQIPAGPPNSPPRRGRVLARVLIPAIGVILATGLTHLVINGAQNNAATDAQVKNLNRIGSGLSGTHLAPSIPQLGPSVSAARTKKDTAIITGMVATVMTWNSGATMAQSRGLATSRYGIPAASLFLATFLPPTAADARTTSAVTKQHFETLGANGTTYQYIDTVSLDQSSVVDGIVKKTPATVTFLVSVSDDGTISDLLAAKSS